jgi:chromate transport protein ChrA
MVTRQQANEKMESKAELKDIAKLFLKLGIIGFGGPAPAPQSFQL